MRSRLARILAASVAIGPQGPFVSEAFGQAVNAPRPTPVPLENIFVGPEAGPAAFGPADTPLLPGLGSLPVDLDLTSLVPVESQSASSVRWVAPFSKKGSAPFLQEGATHAKKVAATFFGQTSRLLSKKGSDPFLGRGGARGLNSAPLDTAFDRAKTRGSDAFDPEKIRVFITRHGQDPVPVGLGSLGEALAAAPGLAESLNAKGRVRVVIAGKDPNDGLTRDDEARLKEALKAQGVSAKLDVEEIPIQWAQRPSEPAGPATRTVAERSLVRRIVTWPFREAAYLARALRAGWTAPTRAELAMAALTKGPFLAVGLGVWGEMFLPAHPAAFAAAAVFTAYLAVFHGAWTNAWANFQNIISRQRGIHYQTGFNLVYGQAIGIVFRLIVWSAIAGTVPPWAPSYWRDLTVATLVGTFIGTLGYQGTNVLYNKGLVTRSARSGLQLLRNLFMDVCGVLFGSGSMLVYWVVFGVQQVLDVLIYAVSQRLPKRPILYIASDHVAATPEFQTGYPVRPGPELSPLKAALKAIVEAPLFKPIVALVKKIREILKGKGIPRRVLP